MYKAIILLSRRDDMSAEEFRSWWLDEHAPIAAQLPHLRRVTFNLVADSVEIDGVSELWFDSEADFEAAYSSPIGQSVAADSLAHLRTRRRLIVTEHLIVDEREGTTMHVDRPPADQPTTRD